MHSALDGKLIKIHCFRADNIRPYGCVIISIEWKAIKEIVGEAISLPTYIKQKSILLGRIIFAPTPDLCDAKNGML